MFVVINACYICAACDDANCIECTDRETCTSCGFGYYLNDSHGCSCKSKEYCTHSVLAKCNAFIKINFIINY